MIDHSKPPFAAVILDQRIASAVVWALEQRLSDYRNMGDEFNEPFKKAIAEIKRAFEVKTYTKEED